MKMKLRQKFLRIVYPLWMAFTRVTGRHTVTLHNTGDALPPASFYELEFCANNGQIFSFTQLRGKKVLLVNTASDCGYTAQLKELEELQNKYGESLLVIGFPSNDFNQQEKGSDKEIAAFCQMNYGTHFLLAKKTVVKKGPHQHPIFNWLTHKEKNGWNTKEPSWNFSKYLVNEKGLLTHYFDPSISPVADTVRKAIENSF